MDRPPTTTPPGQPSAATTLTDGGAPIITIAGTGGQPVVVNDEGTCAPPFSISLCTAGATCL
jgi:hypothetical protein